MDSRRQMKISSLIKEAFTEILSKQGFVLPGKAFITVTNVKVTSDVSQATFYLSIFNADNPDDLVNEFNDHKTDFKRALGEKLRFNLRRIPEIKFFRDETLDQVFKLDDLFTKIKAEDEKIKSEIKKPVGRPRKK